MVFIRTTFMRNNVENTPPNLEGVPVGPGGKYSSYKKITIGAVDYDMFAGTRSTGRELIQELRAQTQTAEAGPDWAVVVGALLSDGPRFYFIRPGPAIRETSTATPSAIEAPHPHTSHRKSKIAGTESSCQPGTVWHGIILSLSQRIQIRCARTQCEIVVVIQVPGLGWNRR